MSHYFNYLSGTTTGIQHIRTGKNNQDSFGLWSDKDFLIGIVADGCGSSKHSEVGAKIGMELLKSEMIKLLPALLSQEINRSMFQAFLERIYRDTLSQIRVLANAMDSDIIRIISDYFLFTAIVCLILPKVTIIFSIGDGAYMINEKLYPLGFFPGNKPPYLCYGLFNPATVNMPVDQLQFQINFFGNTEDVDSICIATDGIMDLFDANNDYQPIAQNRVEPMINIINDDDFFQNPDNLRRWLSLLNKEKRNIDWAKQSLMIEPGLLMDDTTLIMMKRNQQ